MSDPENTTPEMLMAAAEIGKRNGLRYVYAGNLPGRVGDLEHTRCHHCRRALVERYGYFIQSYRLTPDGTCPDCGTSIPGRWGAASTDRSRPRRSCPAAAACGRFEAPDVMLGAC